MKNTIELVMEEAFNAGVEYGKDSMNTTTHKYPHEMTKPTFEEWYKEFSLNFNQLMFYKNKN